jgi:glycosyltransferase involved in cell wall biosynthesis
VRILICSQHFWPENFHINEVATLLAKRGHHIEVLTAKPNYPNGVIYDGYSQWGIQNESWNGITLHRVPIFPRGNSGALRLSLNYLSFVFFAFVFSINIFRKKRFDLIFVYGVSPIIQVLPASFLGWIKRVPVVLWIQDLWPESVFATGYVRSKPLLVLISFLVKLCYEVSDLILVQSRGFISEVKKIAPNKKIRYYPNSVSDEFLNPAPSSKFQLESLSSGFSILFAGNIGQAQSIDTIAAAAKKLEHFRDIRFVILGSGSKLPWLKNEIKTKNINNIYIEGSYPIEAMPHLMRQASVLLASLSDQHIFSLTVPNKIQAYLASGRPIIASMNGEGARIVIEANAGFSSPAENSDALVSAIIKMYELSQLQRDQLGRNGQLYFNENFDEHMLMLRLEKYLFEAIEE